MPGHGGRRAGSGRKRKRLIIDDIPAVSTKLPANIYEEDYYNSNDINIYNEKKSNCYENDSEIITDNNNNNVPLVRETICLQYITDVKKYYGSLSMSDKQAYYSALLEGASWFFPPAFISSNIRSGKTIKPNIFYYPNIFVWDPIVYGYFDMYKCYYCGSKCMSKGFSNPRMVQGVYEKFFLLGKVMQCKTKTCSTFNTYDSEFLNTLPKAMEILFPFKIQHKSAYCKDLIKLVESLRLGGMSAAAIKDLINNCRLERYKEKVELYKEMVKLIITKLESENIPREKIKVIEFSEYSDKSGYYGATFSSIPHNSNDKDDEPDESVET